MKLLTIKFTTLICLFIFSLSSKQLFDVVDKEIEVKKVQNVKIKNRGKNTASLFENINFNQVSEKIKNDNSKSSSKSLFINSNFEKLNTNLNY